MLFRELISVCSKNFIKRMTALCGQTAELLNFKESGTYNYH